MSAFRFRLERVLWLRRQTLQTERVVLAQRLRRVEQAGRAQRVGQAAAREAAGGLYRMVSAPAPGSDAPAAASGQEVGTRLVLLAETNRRLAFLDGQLAEARRAVEEQRVRVVEARRAVRMLELLRERRLREHLRLEQRREAGVLDEAGLSGFWREHFAGP